MIGARTWMRAARDAAPVLAVLALCPVAAALAPADPAAPLARLDALIAVQETIGLPAEAGLVGWLAAHPALAAAAHWFHLLVHLPATVGVMVWAWLERRAAFALVRDTFVAAQALTIAGNVAVPVAPPWMLERGGAPLPESWVYLLQSPYAAMPSGHMVFALVAGGALFALTRSVPLRAAALAYPVVVLLVIVTTANHLWIDAIAGAVVAGVAFAGVAAWRRAPRLRTVRPAPAAAIADD